jgi:hypothetical protein
MFRAGAGVHHEAYECRILQRLADLSTAYQLARLERGLVSFGRLCAGAGLGHIEKYAQWDIRLGHPNLLEIFNQLDAAALDEFIRQGQEEHLHLDFKTVSNANLNGADDKKNLAKAVSGFANSSGGLIVWGVDARKNPLGIDCASGLNEISPIQLFVSRLTTLTGQSVSPLVDGIIHKPIIFGAEKGCAVTLVPESQARIWQNSARTDTTRGAAIAFIGWSISILRTCLDGAKNRCLRSKWTIGDVLKNI